MAGEAAAALMAIQAAQMVLNDFDAAFNFGAFLCPTETPIENITSIGEFNFIIIGAGTAGSVLANRLSECPSVSVLVIEAGGCPPLEALLLGMFPLVPRTKIDYDMYSTDDKYALQNLQGGKAGITVGKMIGGSSCLHHAIFVRGGKPDYESWARAANDSSWSYDGLLPYFIRSENVYRDKDVVQKYRKYHGTCGNSKVKKQPSAENCGIIESFIEMNYTYRIDTNNDDVLGAFEPFLQVDDQYRQCGLVSYIYPVKDRPNLYVLTGATATKIIFKNKKAIGVRYSYEGRSYIAKSKNEVIVSAGAIKTPQLLMLSGVGPAEHLRSKNIPIVSNLPVGKNLQDHVSAAMIFGLQRDASPTPAVDFTKFPTPMTVDHLNLDDRFADFAQYQGVNLLIPQNNEGFIQLCLNAFKFKLSVCQNWFEANVNRKVWLRFPTLLKIQSRGELLLNTTNIDDQPIVKFGYLSNGTDDLANLAEYLAFSIKILDTNYFKEVGAEFFDFGMCSEHRKYSKKYWECYGLAMSSTMWHYCGTAALGTVVDGKLRVRGVTGLRVVDASTIPVIPGGKVIAAVLATAEKGADIIRAAYENLFCCP